MNFRNDFLNMQIVRVHFFMLLDVRKKLLPIQTDMIYRLPLS